MRHYLLLPYCPSSADTIRRVSERLDAARFTTCFMAWMQEVLPAERAGQRCVDGKILRGSGPKPLHIVSVVASASGLSLAGASGRAKHRN